MKKFVLFLSSIVLFGSISFGANLTISPDRGNIGSNCIKSVDLVLGGLSGAAITAADVLLSTNMSFVDFVPSGLFDNTMPPILLDNGVIRLGLFSMDDFVETSGTIGTLYVRMFSGLDEGFISFIYDKGKTIDTNLFIEGGIDILKDVNDGYYTNDGKVSCNEDPVIEGGFLGLTYDESISNLKKDLSNVGSGFVVETFIKKYGFIVLGVLLLSLFGFILRKKGKKGIK